MKHCAMDKEQNLIDIMFDIALTVHDNEWFEGKSNEEVANWVADILRQSGYDTTPMGSSWGKLKK